MSDIREALRVARDKTAAAHNISVSVGRCADKGLLHSDGTRRGTQFLWSVTESGETAVRELLGLKRESVGALHPEILELTSVANTIANDDARDYLLEAIKCLGAEAMRAAIVFAWSGAMRLIHQHLYDEFRGDRLNAALEKHKKNVKQIYGISDWAFVNDDVVLKAAAELKVFDKSQHKRLCHALDDRNDCGHPSNFRPTPTKTKAILEDLTNLVYKTMS